MPEAEQLNILVVDDDRDMLAMLEAVLTMEKYSVSLCQDPIDCVDIACREKPSLILLDVMMPGKSGLELMMDIRSTEATREIPILFLSAVEDEAVVVKALKGADDYVVKPFKTLELLARVSKILDRSREEPATTGKALDRLPVQRGDETFLVPLAEIVYFEAAGKYSYAHTRKRKFLTGYSLGELEARLEPSRFIRTHRSYIVNAEAVSKVTRHKTRGMMVVLADEQETTLKVSESHLPGVRQRLGL